MDRNANFDGFYWWVEGSLSARRAWIEMIFPLFQLNLQRVALRKESVDRNFYYADKDADWVRRSPQGERG